MMFFEERIPESDSVPVPSGVYIIGDGIPSGKWTISYTGSSIGKVQVYTDADAYKNGHLSAIVDTYLEEGDTTTVIVEDGQYLTLMGASNTYYFTPFSASALGF